MNGSRFAAFLNLSVGVGRPFGIPVRLHITILFFLWPAFAGRSIGFGHALEYAAAIVLSILVHELGHALTAKRYGMTGLSIMLHGFGGFAMSSGRRTPRQSLVIVLAGPGATFALGLLLLALAKLGGNVAEFGTEASFQAFLIGAVGRLNILLGFLNLIPVLPWDGGQALQAILGHRMTEIKAMRAAAHLGLVLAPILLVYGFFTDQNFFGLFALVGLLTCYSTLANSGGIRFGEAFADRTAKKETEAVRQRERARQEGYLSDVKQREKEREERERLRKLFGESGIED